MLIDTHAHLNFKAFNKDRKQVIDRAQKAGVEKIIIPGAKIDSSVKAVEIANKYPNCYAAAGIHPHHTDEINTSIHNSIKVSDVIKQLSGLIKNRKVVAVGETGLDYHRYQGYPLISDEIKTKQKELFLLQFELAAKNNLPVIIHCREAQDDLLSILKQFSVNHKITGVFHCFSGNIQYLEKVLGMGFYVGFDGNITYEESTRLQLVVRNTPLDRILAETDSPYLTPLPLRGNRNEPANLPLVISKISEIYQKKPDEIADVTTNNAMKLFRL